ncbi:MAG: AAA family ATPase, partial [Candidatus Riflebacteria bacterium]|nr:AAA family ATPase [Candidatus Riflebacteria bacterium]
MTANAGPPERLITTVRLGDGRRPPVRLPILQLRVVEGPDRGLSVAIGEGPVRVGKGVDSQLLLSDAAVSRTHFVVERQPDGLVLLDQ